MTIRIYPGQIPSKPIEEHEYSGNLGAWFDACEVEFRGLEVQPILLYVNDVEISSDLWDETEVLSSDNVDIRPNPRGGVFKLVGSVFKFFFGWLMPKGAGASNRTDTGRGRQLQSAEGKANTAKLNQAVPEQFGYFKRYPEYLVQPRRRFSGPREQMLDLLLCLGPGEYHDPQIYVGNTPISTLAGATYQIHQPGANLSGVEAAQNWYSAPEVGGTSAGTAGLDLTAIADTDVNPSASSYTFDGPAITATSNFPDSWAPGLTVMSLYVMQSVTVASVPDGESGNRNTFTANWQEIAPTVGLQLNASGALTGTVRVDSVSGNTITLSRPGSEGWEPVRNIAVGDRDISLSRIGRTYTLQSMSGSTITLGLTGGGSWAGFAPQTTAASRVIWAVQPDTVLGETAGPFVICPASEKSNQYEIDLFFPQGLYSMNDAGDLVNRTVRVLIQWRDFDSGGAWSSTTKTYTQRTLDQIGFTEVINTGSAIRGQFRVSRLGARTTSSRAQDVVQWYGARSRLATRTVYPDWTTISLRIRGLGQISANSENQIQVTSTRKLPTLTSPTPVPTRSISAAVMYIARSVGYSDSNIDLATLAQLENSTWTPRGETQDFVYDETTAKSAIESVLMSGMAEMTVDDGLITVVREGPRTVFEQDYSAQNMTGELERTFTATRPDDNDGVEVEYQDENDGWSTKTVRCLLPGSIGIKTEKIKLNGVTSRTRAWRIGMRRAGEQRYRRWQYTFGTELDLLNSSYKGYVALCPDIPGMGQSALAYEYSSGVLKVSEPMDWSGSNHIVAIGQPDGSIAGPYPCTRGATDYDLVCTIPSGKMPSISLDSELPRVLFGTSDRWVFPALITKITPNNSNQVKATAVNYDSRVYEYDDATPQPE